MKKFSEYYTKKVVISFTAIGVICLITFLLQEKFKKVQLQKEAEWIVENTTLENKFTNEWRATAENLFGQASEPNSNQFLPSDSIRWLIAKLKNLTRAEKRGSRIVDEGGYWYIQTDDNVFVKIWKKDQSISINNGTDMRRTILRTDSLGNIIWLKFHDHKYAYDTSTHMWIEIKGKSSANPLGCILATKVISMEILREAQKRISASNDPSYPQVINVRVPQKNFFRTSKASLL